MAATIVVALAVAAIALGVAAASGTVPAGSPPGLETGLAGATASSARAVASAPASSPILFASPTATSAADAPASPEPSGTASPAGAASLPAASAVPGGPATPQLDPPPSPGPFEIDLYAKGDFVSELTKEMCVPAAIQTMANIMGSETDRSGRTQRRLYARARALSPPTLVGPGAEPAGWAATLDELGFGPYRVDVEPTRGSAIAAAAKALRMTGRPVGLLVWRGAHSWVVSGFQATTDPAWTDEFRVTALYVEDVWYPRISSIWGASRPPDALVPVGRMGEDYLPWRRPTRRYPAMEAKYVLVLPVTGPSLPVIGSSRQGG